MKEKIDYQTLIKEVTELYKPYKWFHEAVLSIDDAGYRIDVIANKDFWSAHEDPVDRKYKNVFLCVLVKPVMVKPAIDPINTIKAIETNV